jgi:hypothetical protein
MLLTLATQQPRMLLTIVQHTPSWVWMLLAALIWLGASQFFARSAGLRRVLLMPVAMTVFSVWGLGSAFGALPQLPAILGAWLVAACAVAALSLWLLRTAPAGTRYDATLQRFELPGSGWPLLLILGIFLVKWAVGVELALQPMLAHDSHFALQIALVYGVFNGVFAARTGRLLRLAKTRTSAPEDFITA